ncbi:MAG: carboxypeptidase M32 [Candidatus Hydrogenedentes bacterium]|nr:carboxypeptidase M32 [Candidatus Hydrogenedentota bacterium]
MDNQLECVKEKLQRILSLRAILSLLHWDEEVFMPPKGAESRARQLKVMAELIHEFETDKCLLDELDSALEKREGLSDDEFLMLEEARYDLQRALKVPSKWVGKFTEMRSKAYHSWVEARKNKNFLIFAPYLEELVLLLRERAEYLGYVGSPYNALLEDYERGVTVEKLESIFNELLEKQTSIYKTLLDKQDRYSKFSGKEWSTEKQQELSTNLLTKIGFDFNAGRQDISIHPFTTNLDLFDVRITTRFSKENPFSGIYSSLHECGHALYEQGFKLEDRGTWIAQAPSYGIHEAMSRFWENIVGRSLSFCKYLYGLLTDYFPGEMAEITPEEIYMEVNRIKENFIRVEADECSYNLHIILRFIIERELIEGKISVNSVPDRWNSLFIEIFGLCPPDDTKGCLQDIHWSHGSFGYFPSYALGNIFSAQIAERLKTEIEFNECIEKGDFAPIKDWLKENIFEVGRRFKAVEIVEKVSNKPLSSQPFINYLREKYSDLYKVVL